MMANERLIDKNTRPTDEDMKTAIGSALENCWTGLRIFLVDTYDIEPVLQFGGPRYGWNLQHRKGGRPLCEMYPEQNSFTALVILGKVELELALKRIDSFGPKVRKALLETPRFHDGCWMYIRIPDPQTCQQDVEDIKQLILIKKKPPRKKAT